MTKKINITELKNMLKKGTVKFQYMKNNGEIRTAVGTLKSDLISHKSCGGMNKTKDAGYTTYFDVEKNWWRCFAESKLVGVVEE